MTRWLAQYLDDEKMYYLTEHGNDGIEGEHFFDLLCHYYQFIKENNLTVRYEPLRNEKST